MADKVLVAIWLCGLLGVLMMAARLVFGRIYKAKWDLGDSLNAVAIVLAIARLVFLHLTVTYKTNNISDAYLVTNTWTAEEMSNRQLGAKYALVSRVLYICMIWSMKFVLLSFYHQMVRDITWGRISVRVFTVVFVATGIAGIVSTFVECRPIHLYWQVVPSPGKCAQAVLQLLIVGITNIITDVMLIGLPIPILVSIRLSVKKKIQLAFLFSIGFIIVIITAIRLPFTLRSRSTLGVRLTWTSVELLAATFVANAPKLYGLRHLVHRRRESSVAAMRQRSVTGLGNVNGDKCDHDRGSIDIDGICHIEDIARSSEDPIVGGQKRHNRASVHGTELEPARKVTRCGNA